ncbi:TolC family protein [Pokkaliibacter sp. CJK22405]|uniref:TolC family protein n=1 Tax=Pokkaliibacter sp. CJK22405 TaxID=3384615 RepID=UPI003984F5B9
MTLAHRYADTSKPSGSRKLLGLSLIALMISGCAVSTEPLNNHQTLQRAKQDMSQMYLNQEPVSGPITLHEAMARALKYNLEARLKLMEQALSERQLDVASFDMLPRVALEAGYTGRNNISASSSRSVQTGTQSLEPSTSLDNDRDVADLTMVWNVLDFGVSYVAAQQKSDQRWIAEEQRRKVVQTVVNDVRSAYWRAVAAERLLSKIDKLLDRVNAARRSSERMSSRSIGDPVVALNYQRTLIETTRQLEQQRRALSLAKTELATLMNLPLGTDYQLAIPNQKNLPVPQLNVDFNTLETAALIYRPELREQDYKVRISAAETKKTLLRMLPGLEVQAGGHYDSNSFLVNQSWADLGVKVTWNLFNLISGPSAHRAAEAGEAVAEAQRKALSLAVLAQLYVANANYSEAIRQYKTSQELRDIDDKILVQQRNRYRVQSIGELDLIRSELNAVTADLRQDLAYADLRNSYGQIFSTVGLDMLPKTLPSASVADISKAIASQEQKWQQGDLSDLKAAVNAPMK